MGWVVGDSEGDNVVDCIVGDNVVDDIEGDNVGDCVGSRVSMILGILINEFIANENGIVSALVSTHEHCSFPRKNALTLNLLVPNL